MESYRKYFSDTEHATISMFENLNFYLDLLSKIDHPIFISNRSNKKENDEELNKWIKQNRDKILVSLEKGKEYFGYSISKSTICGSILQIAFMGILQFSTNTTVPNKWKAILKEGNKAVRFCIGRKVREVPIGLIIYAGRNQYNHMDEKKYYKTTTCVFNSLSNINLKNDIKDPAFDLDQPKITNYSSNILAILGWNNYENYVIDMFDLFKK